MPEPIGVMDSTQSMSIALVGTLISLGLVSWALYRWVAKLQRDLQEERLRAAQALAQVSALETELNTELGAMMKIENQAGTLDPDMSFCITDEWRDQEMDRVITIQCPGVRHCDVVVNFVFNGCIVKISRAIEWEKGFQFRPSEGLFEFKEDQAKLEQGLLQLVFRTYDIQSRVFRFPHHFDLSAADNDATWTFPIDVPTICDAGTSAKEALTAPVEIPEATMAETLRSPLSEVGDVEATPAGLDLSACQGSLAASEDFVKVGARQEEPQGVCQMGSASVYAASAGSSVLAVEAPLGDAHSVSSQATSASFEHVHCSGN